VSFSDLIANWN